MTEPRPTYDVGGSDLERAFLTYWRTLAPDAPEPVREYRFHPSRRWRFDCAWVEQRVAVELEGGSWSGGRHVRGAGYRGDCEKQNAALELGWRCYRVTSEMLADDPAGIVGMIRHALDWRL